MGRSDKAQLENVLTVTVGFLNQSSPVLGNSGPGRVPGLALSLTESDSWVRTIKVRPPVGYTLHICFTWRGFEQNTSMDAAVYMLHKRDTLVQADSGNSFSMDPMSLLPKDKLSRVNLVGCLWPLQQLVLEHNWALYFIFFFPLYCISPHPHLSHWQIFGLPWWHDQIPTRKWPKPLVIILPSQTTRPFAIINRKGKTKKDPHR